MKLNPYLAFDGRCREAFEFYASTFGGKAFIQTIGESPMASSTPSDAHGRVMHATLQIGDQVLQGADAPLGQFTKPAGFCVITHFDDAAEGERVFEVLAQKGMVQMPFQATFWAKGFGVLIDQFDIPWIVNAGESTG
jgi:PhnB protein